MRQVLSWTSWPPCRGSPSQGALPQFSSVLAFAPRVLLVKASRQKCCSWWSLECQDLAPGWHRPFLGEGEGTHRASAPFLLKQQCLLTRSSLAPLGRGTLKPNSHTMSLVFHLCTSTCEDSDKQKMTSCLRVPGWRPNQQLKGNASHCHQGCTSCTLSGVRRGEWFLRTHCL